LSEIEPLVSILVLNYNGKKFLKECFDSLLQSTYPNVEIILVDNSSTDDSVDFTRLNYKTIKIIQLQSNVGYSKGYNLAFAHAKGKYFVLLNNDVKVQSNWLDALVVVSEKDNNIGALQPKLLSMNNPHYFEYAGASGGFIDKYGYPFLRGRIFNTIEVDQGQYNDVVEVFWTCGAALFIRADALTKCQTLDENFIFHMEEIDLCWRLHLVGYKLMVIPQSRVYHHAGGSLKQGSYRKIYFNYRNNIMMIMKNLELKNLFKLLFIRYILEIINLFYALCIKFSIKEFFAIFNAHIWIITHIGSIIRKRRVVQNMRTIADKDLKRLIYDKSIVIDYFIKSKKTFASLNFSEVNK
jgi:GT2 family glycosyltransferase